MVLLASPPSIASSRSRKLRTLRQHAVAYLALPWLTAEGGMEDVWRPKVEAHRPQIVLKIKQKLEKLVAPGGDDAARETKLNHIATQFETMQWRDASTRHDYTERITKKLSELEAQVPAAVPAPAVAAAPFQEGARAAPFKEAPFQEAQQHRERALQEEQAQREAHRRRQQEDAGKLMQQHQAQAAAQLQAQQAAAHQYQERHRAQQQQQQMLFRREQAIKQQREQQQHEQAMKLQPQLQPSHQGAREALAVPLPVPPLPVGRAIGPPQPSRKQPPQPGQPSLLTSSGQPVEAPRYRALGEAGISHASSAAAPQPQPSHEDPATIDARYWQVQAKLAMKYGYMVSQLCERFRQQVRQEGAGGSGQKNFAIMTPIKEILSEGREAATALKTQHNLEEIRKVFEVLKKITLHAEQSSVSRRQPRPSLAHELSTLCRELQAEPAADAETGAANRSSAATEPPAKRARALAAAPAAPRGWSESFAAKAAWGALPVRRPPRRCGGEGGEAGGAAGGAAEAIGGVEASSAPCLAPCWAALRGAARVELRELLEVHRFEGEARSASCAAPPQAGILRHIALWPPELRACGVPALCVAIPVDYPAEPCAFGVQGCGAGSHAVWFELAAWSDEVYGDPAAATTAVTATASGGELGAAVRQLRAAAFAAPRPLSLAAIGLTWQRAAEAVFDEFEAAALDMFGLPQ